MTIGEKKKKGLILKEALYKESNMTPAQKSCYAANIVKYIPVFYYKLNATMTGASYCQNRASHFQNNQSAKIF